MPEHLESILEQFQSIATWQNAAIGVVAGLILRLCWKFVRRGLWLLGAPVRLLWRVSRPLADGVSPEASRLAAGRSRPGLSRYKVAEFGDPWTARTIDGFIYYFDSKGGAWRMSPGGKPERVKSGTVVDFPLSAPDEPWYTDRGIAIPKNRLGEIQTAPSDKHWTEKPRATCPECECFLKAWEPRGQECTTCAEMAKREAREAIHCRDCGEAGGVGHSQNRCEPCWEKFRAEDQERQRQAMRDLNAAEREIGRGPA